MQEDEGLTHPARCGVSAAGVLVQGGRPGPAGMEHVPGGLGRAVPVPDLAGRLALRQLQLESAYPDTHPPGQRHFPVSIVEGRDLRLSLLLMLIRGINRWGI